jgi:hypothetical protein
LRCAFGLALASAPSLGAEREAGFDVGGIRTASPCVEARSRSPPWRSGSVAAIAAVATTTAPTAIPAPRSAAGLGASAATAASRRRARSTPPRSKPTSLFSSPAFDVDRSGPGAGCAASRTMADEPRPRLLRARPVANRHAGARQPKLEGILRRLVPRLAHLGEKLAAMPTRELGEGTPVADGDPLQQCSLGCCRTGPHHQPSTNRAPILETFDRRCAGSLRAVLTS